MLKFNLQAGYNDGMLHLARKPQVYEQHCTLRDDEDVVATWMDTHIWEGWRQKGQEIHSRESGGEPSAQVGGLAARLTVTCPKLCPNKSTTRQKQ
jgi:hypothetical protein